MADDGISDEEIAARRGRGVSFAGLLAIEGNPLTAEEVSMFDMFDRERWSDERCRQHLLDQIGGAAERTA